MISIIKLLPDVLVEVNIPFGGEASYYSGQKTNFLAVDVSGTSAYSTAPFKIAGQLSIGSEAFLEENNVSALKISKNSNISTDLGAGVGPSFSGTSKIAATLTDPSFNNSNSSSATSSLVQFWG